MPLRFLLGEELAHILEGLEFEGIAARVEQEHGGLLANLSFESNVRFDHKFGTERLEALCQRFPFFPSQDDAEVRNRNVVPVDRVAVNALLRGGFRVFVNHQLMPVKVEVDPLVTGTTLFQAKDLSVKSAGCSQVVNGDGEVEWRKAHQDSDTVFVVGEHIVGRH